MKEPKRVVVIGAGQGGLSAAIHARLKGHSVLVLEKNEIGGKAAGIQIGGYRLDPGPSIIILPSIYRSVFERAGKNIDDYLQFERLDPITRVFFQGDVIDIPAGLDGASKLVHRVAPEDGDAFDEMMEKLGKVAPLVNRSVFDHPYEKPWQLVDPNLIKIALPFDVRLSYKEIVDQAFKSPLLRAFFYGFPSYGGQSYHSKAAGALLIPYYMLSEGVFYPKGGVSQIPAAFARLATELGVEIDTGVQINEVNLNGSKAVSVESTQGQTFSADHFIFNRDRLSTEPWLKRNQPEQASYSYFTVHWGVPKPLPNVLHHSLIVPDDFETGFEELYQKRVFPKKPIVYLNNTSLIDPTVSPEGSTNLFAVVTSPAREDHFSWNEVTEQCVSAVHGLFQPLGISFDRSEAEFERIQNPLYFETKHENFRGSLYGADERFRVFGLFPWRNQDEQIRNISYVGGAVQPGAGLPMVTLGGKFAAECIK